MKKLFSFLLSFVLLFTGPAMNARAEDVWPDDINIEAEGGIVMEASTGTILSGKNIHETFYPASITKILTALIVLETCNLDETVTFSHDAIYNVESGSTSAGMDVGDTLSVQDCLYALLLKSANEVANALAEHVAGSIDDFAVLMNQKAASLGCADSHFANPSGLNNEEHYTSAYDMALISQAALQNPVFVEIDSKLYYDLPPTKRNPDGLRIYPGHRMFKKNLAEYYEGCFGGKTGYTTLAGNTLVTFARRGNMTLIAVVLNGRQSHYRDTKKLLDFGFNNFKNLAAAEFDHTYTSIENDMTIAGLPTSELSRLQLDPEGMLTLPVSGDFSTVSSHLNYDLPDNAPAGAIARVDYSWGGRNAGFAYLTLDTLESVTAAMPAALLQQIADITAADESSTEESAAASEPQELERIRVPSFVWKILGILAAVTAAAAIVTAYMAYRRKKEAEARRIRRQKRMERLGTGAASLEFDLQMERRRREMQEDRTRRRPRGNAPARRGARRRRRRTYSDR